MQIFSLKSSKVFVFILSGILLASCGSVEIGFEDDPGSVSTEGSGDGQDSPPATADDIDQPDDPMISLPSLVHNAQAPEMVSIGSLTPTSGWDIGVVVREENQVFLQDSPIQHNLFWGYTPVTGRLAFSSEFWGPASDGSRVSVSDLWVYDYVSGQSEQWLDANVAYARWSPDGVHLAAAIWNLDAGRYDMALVTGPNQVQIVGECGSVQFDWSPYGDQLAYANLAGWAGVRPECQGVYVVSFEDGFEDANIRVDQVSSFGAQGQLNGGLNDRPIWAWGQEALIVLDTPFWVVPMNGSEAYVPTMPDGQDPILMPRLVNPLWVPELRQLVGYVETGMSQQGGVWVYQFSEDMTSITEVYRIEAQPTEGNSDLSLLDWWEPGISLLLLDHNMALENEFLSDWWGKPVIWSLADRTFLPQP